MTNPPRQKGTRGENWFARHLCQIWPTIERAPLKGTNDYGDFVNCGGWLLEAKHTKRPLVLQWLRIIRRKCPGGRWALLWKGDGRTEDGEAFVVVSLPTFLAMAAVYEPWRRQQELYAMSPDKPWELT